MAKVMSGYTRLPEHGGSIDKPRQASIHLRLHWRREFAELIDSNEVVCCCTSSVETSSGETHCGGYEDGQGTVLKFVWYTIPISG